MGQLTSRCNPWAEMPPPAKATLRSARASAMVLSAAASDPRRASVDLRSALRLRLCESDAELERMHGEIEGLGAKAFAIMDVGKKSYVTSLDAIKLYARLGVKDRQLQDDAWGEILKEANTARNGKISATEWSAWVADLADKSCAPYEISEIHEELTTICEDLRRASSMVPAHFSTDQMALLRKAAGLDTLGEGVEEEEEEEEEEEGNAV